MKTATRSAVLLFFAVASGVGADAPPPGFLGMGVAPVDPKDRDRFGLQPGQSGVLVLGVTPEGPVEKAGLKEGDVLVTFDGKTLESPQETVNAFMRDAPPGRPVKVEFLRAGKPQTAVIVIGTPPTEAEARQQKKEAMKRQREQMLAGLPTGLRETIQAKQEADEKKRKALAEKYKAEGLSDEEIEKRVKEEVPDIMRKGQ